MYINFSLIVSDTDTGSPPSPRFNHQPQRRVGGFSAQPRSLPAPTATNKFTTLAGGPPLPRPSLFQPPTSRYDSLVVFLPSPGPHPPQPPPTSLRHSLVGPPSPWPSLFQPPMSHYDSLVAHSPQPWSSPTPTATNEFTTLVGGSSLALAFLPCPIHQ